MTNTKGNFDRDINVPIKFQPIPKRFMVWDLFSKMWMFDAEESYDDK